MAVLFYSTAIFNSFLYITGPSSGFTLQYHVVATLYSAAIFRHDSRILISNKQLSDILYFGSITLTFLPDRTLSVQEPLMIIRHPSRNHNSPVCLTIQGRCTMLIPILRTDNNYDFVKEFILDSLIESKEIVKFKRITGWVTIGTDKVRVIRRSSVVADAYSEKRSTIQ
jgi:hypothetical protein